MAWMIIRDWWGSGRGLWGCDGDFAARRPGGHIYIREFHAGKMHVYLTCGSEGWVSGSCGCLGWSHVGASRADYLLLGGRLMDITPC